MNLESDPNGLDPHQAGAKLDAGKNRLGLVLGGFARALVEVGKVGTYGANKYTDDGWLSVPNGEARYTDALLRHLMFEYCGEATDGDSNLSHAAHAAWNALARLELAIRREQLQSDGETPEQVRDVRDIGVEEKQEDPGGVRAREMAVRSASFYPPIYPRRQNNPTFWSRDLCRVEGEARRRDKEEDDSCS